MTSKLKIAFLCDRLGPYHVARLNAASCYAEITVLEFSASDLTYAWDTIGTSFVFKRVTLFNDGPINLQSIDSVISSVNNALDTVRPQIVAIPGWDAPASLIALAWCLHNDTPSILMSDSQKHDEPRVWLKELVKGQVVKLHSSGFVAGLTHVDYLKFLGMRESQIVTGIDVVDNDFFYESSIKTRKDADATRKIIGVSGKYFLASSRFIKKKNLFSLLKAYASYCEKADGDVWKLVLLGDGQLKNEIIKFRDELGLSEHIILPGFKQYNELPAFYGLAGAFVHASTSEQWGLVVNEAMACGLPVIVSTPCGCAPELIKHGLNGYTFNPNNVLELAELMVRVSSAQCNIVEMGYASRKIISYWSLDAFALGLLKAANLALESNQSKFNFIRKAILWGLIHFRKS